MESRLSQEEITSDYTDLDVIYEKISPKAKYPVWLCIALSVVLWVPAGCFLTSDVILAAKPDDYECLSVLANSSEYVDYSTNGNIARASNNSLDKCDPNCDNYRFHFNDSWTTNTVITDFKLICGKEKQVYDFKTGTMMGLFPGVLAAGTISDRWGRKRTIIIVSILASVAAVGTKVLAPYSVGFYIVGRILMNACAHGASVIGFVYVMEVSSPEYRTQVGMFVCGVIFALGVMLGSFIAWAFDSWETMLLSMACLHLFIIPFIPILPESFRWYFSTGRTEEGRRSLHQFSKKCGPPLDSAFLDNVVRDQKPLKDEKRVIVMVYELFKNSVTRTVVLKMFFLWMVIVMYYFSLLLGDLPGSIIVNNAINGAMEGLGALSAILAIKKSWFFRTKSIMIGLLVSGVVTIGASLFFYLYESQNHDETYRKLYLALSFFGFLSMSAVFAILFVYTGEMFPTVIRASSFAVCSLGGRFGSLIAPQISKLRFVVPGLDGILFTVLTFAGAYVCSSLPETQGRELMQTVEETEIFFMRKGKETHRTEFKVLEELNHGKTTES